MKSILFKNARLIDPSQKLDAPGSILVTGSKIAWLGTGKEQPAANDCQVIDAGGLVICPGFIDLHCHLRDPGFEEKENIASGTLAAARGGYTTICCMPNTEPAIDNASVVNYVKEKAAVEGTIRVLPIGCITKGRKGESLSEMGELAQAGVIGFSDDGSSVMNSRLMRQALDYSKAFDLPVIEHCEDKQLVENGQMNEGIVASRLGLAGIPAAAEENILARDIALAELTGARLHLAHVSTAGSVELVKAAKRKNLRVTAEVTPHHLTLTEERVLGYDTNAKVNPPLRTLKDIQALIQGLKDNIIDAIATDHAPHTLVEKNCEFAYAPFGISNFETAFGSLMALIHQEKLDLNTLISKLTAGPAAIIGDKFGKLGTLAVGASADLTVLDPEKVWKVDPAAFASRGKNTPLTGETLKGKIMATVYLGKIVYKDETFVV